MKLPTWTPWAAFAALFLLLGLAWRSDRQAIADNAVTKALLAADDSAIRAAHRVEVRYDTVFVHDTVTFTRWRVDYQHVHDTVLTHLTDTVRVKEFVAVADSTIHACTRALGDCEQVTAALRLQLAATTGKVTALERQSRQPLVRGGVDFGYYVIGGVGTPEVTGSATIGRVTGLAGIELYSGRALALYGASVRAYP